jgi:hypothetical protein
MIAKKNFSAWALAVLSTLLFSCNPGNENEPQESYKQLTSERNLDDKELSQRGEFLVTVGGCNDCHSPKKFGPNGMSFDSSKLLSGHPQSTPLPPLAANDLKPGNWVRMTPDVTAFAGPWGISFAANLTPDSATGIGAWTEENFVNIFKTGKHLGQQGGRPILPPMPWFNLASVDKQEIKAIYAYLRSRRPISNKVPAPVPPTDFQKPVTAQHTTASK